MSNSRSNVRSRNQAGYTLLMVVFLVATIMILTAAVSPNLLTEGRREREAETVWRGEQYKRAIGLYFRKFGRYPTKIEDLTRQTDGVRFLRKAYTDPNNKEDGSWRFIYLGPNGQLVGSTRTTIPLQTSSADMEATLKAIRAYYGWTDGVGPAGQQTGNASAPNPLQSQPQPLEGAAIGGSIVGVGSKIKKSSLRIYEGGDTYEKWEFIFTPQQQVAIPGQQPVNPNAPQGTPSPAPPPPGTAPSPPPVPGPGDVPFAPPSVN